MLLPCILTWISIHAPTRGATPCIPPCHSHVSISIHAPTRGATEIASTLDIAASFQSTLPRGERLLALHRHIHFYYFNPRSHEGSDHNSIIPYIKYTGISIHAPTRGATGHVLVSQTVSLYFNPRSHEGSDGIRMTMWVDL